MKSEIKIIYLNKFTGGNKELAKKRLQKYKMGYLFKMELINLAQSLKNN